MIDEDPIRLTKSWIKHLHAVHRFALNRTLQLCHINKLIYWFLHGVASDLDETDKMVLLGTGLTDKQADALDVRISQLKEVLPNLDPDAVLLSRDFPKSTLVRRQVWSKEGKGGPSVRKLILRKSAKDEVWPSWVVHFTDYSPDRKKPLDLTIRTTLSEAEAQAISDDLILDNIKKGWDEVAAPSTSPAKQTAKKPISKSSPSKARTSKQK